MNTCDVAIVGAGPAGLTAGLYASRGLVKTVVFEKQMAGGQIATTDWVENYPAFPEGISGTDLGELMARQAQAFGAHIELFVTVTQISREANGDFVLETDSGESWQAQAVILASGAVPHKLGIPGEADYTGRGVSWCATCDGALYRDKVVAVIGGGDAAVEEALFLTKFARKVYLVHRRDEFRATSVVAERAKAHEQIECVLSAVPVEIVGNGSKVTGLKVRSVVDGSEQLLEVDGVFEFVGIEPQNELAAGLVDAAVLEAGAGYLAVESNGSVAGIPGLFVAGDLTLGPLKQAVTAAAGGATAGFAALRYLESRDNAL